MILYRKHKADVSLFELLTGAVAPHLVHVASRSCTERAPFPSLLRYGKYVFIRLRGCGTETETTRKCLSLSDCRPTVSMALQRFDNKFMLFMLFESSLQTANGLVNYHLFTLDSWPRARVMKHFFCSAAPPPCPFEKQRFTCSLRLNAIYDASLLRFEPPRDWSHKER